jgi:hypothetical protein
MKNLKNSLAIFALVVLFASCEEKSVAPTHDSFILVDNTDSTGSRENLLSKEGVMTLFTDPNGQQAFGKITFSQVNDLSLNGEKVIEFKPFPDGSTELLKKRFTDKFKENLDGVYHHFLGSSGSTDASAVYRMLCNAMEKLSQSDADHKTIVILSDMVENSECGNFYRMPNGATDDALAKLQACRPFPTATGIDVIVLYQPKSQKSDALFRKAMAVWGQLFASHDIKYTVKANM